MLNIAICDDSQLAISVIQESLRKYRNVHSRYNMQEQTFLKGNDLLAAVKGGEIFDLILLDIVMPAIDGINLAKSIRLHDKKVPVIFLTSFPRYALEAYQVNAANYLLKPVNEVELFAALDKVITLQTGDKQLYIPMACGNEIGVYFNQINYLEISGGIIHLHLVNGETLESAKRRISFVSATIPLNRDGRFIKLSANQMLNMEQVDSLTEGSFTMVNGDKVPILKSYQAEAQRRYRDFLSKRNIHQHADAECSFSPK